jgi:EAL domain-containing protein (putative c-di-GMP-specific phosphodiesterase class I)
VESASQLEILNEMGCDEVQGFLLSLPLDASGFAEALEQKAAAREVLAVR